MYKPHFVGEQISKEDRMRSLDVLPADMRDSYERQKASSQTIGKASRKVIERCFVDGP